MTALYGRNGAGKTRLAEAMTAPCEASNLRTAGGASSSRPRTTPSASSSRPARRTPP
ncbi:MAG: hypothetical protein H0U29_11440 [Acidimicrobiia bacterium]|nr:hypothetical protein [Acidimicrobiia bacterium]